VARSVVTIGGVASVIGLGDQGDVWNSEDETENAGGMNGRRGRREFSLTAAVPLKPSVNKRKNSWESRKRTRVEEKVKVNIYRQSHDGETVLSL